MTLLKVGHPLHSDEPPVPLQRPEPGQVPALGAGGGATAGGVGASDAASSAECGSSWSAGPHTCDGESEGLSASSVASTSAETDAAELLSEGRRPGGVWGQSGAPLGLRVAVPCCTGMAPFKRGARFDLAECTV